MDLTPWRVRSEDFPTDGDERSRMKFLLRYAILAPSTRNSQPWRFGIRDGRVEIFGDESRWHRVADPRGRELHISLGCALENLLVAAEHFGYRHHVEYLPGAPGELAAEVRLESNGIPVAERDPLLFRALTTRSTNHRPYDARAISPELLNRLKACCNEEGFSLLLTADPEVKSVVNELVIRADAIVFSDPAFREELGHWIGQGTFGTPWLFAHVGQLAISYLDLGKTFGKKDSRVLLSAPVVGILSSQRDDRETHLKTGQILERILLTATTLGLAAQPMSQAVEVPDIRVELAKSVPLEGGFLPQQPFRLGYAPPEKDHTPRHAVDEVLA